MNYIGLISNFTGINTVFRFERISIFYTFHFVNKKMMKKIYILPALFLLNSLSIIAQNDYNYVAPIFYKRCTSCHHVNGGAPMSLMSYAEIVPYTSPIETYLTAGKMPPWAPDTTYTRFLHERIISKAEKDSIIAWIINGAPEGNPSLAPVAPTYAKYKLLGVPDLILTIPTFTSNAVSGDSYVCFSLPTGLTQDRIIRAFEIVPGNPDIVHHVVVKVDTTGTVVSDLSGACFTEPGNYGLGGFAPGSPPTVFPGQAPLKAGTPIIAGSNLILQIHYPLGSAGQKDSTQIRLYFYPTTATGVRNIYSSTFLQNWLLFLSPGVVTPATAKYPSGSGTLANALSIYAVSPHAHKVNVSMVINANKPGDTIPLIRIPKWDFEHQGFYTFRKMVQAPVGYKLFARHIYDNTTNNPNNPNSPPKLVTAGTNTTDEMLFDSFQWMYYQAGDENIDLEALLANDSILSSVNNPSTIYTKINSSASPNPFNETISIKYELPTQTDVIISVFDIYGKLVKFYTRIQENSGVHEISWNGKNDADINMPAGTYYYTIKAGNCNSIKAGNCNSSGKLVLMK